MFNSVLFGDIYYYGSKEPLHEVIQVTKYFGWPISFSDGKAKINRMYPWIQNGQYCKNQIHLSYYLSAKCNVLGAQRKDKIILMNGPGKTHREDDS